MSLQNVEDVNRSEIQLSELDADETKSCLMVGLLLIALTIAVVIIIIAALAQGIPPQ